jgi:hypothetical protein
MSEESQGKKHRKLTPLATAVLGVVTGVACIGAALLAHHIGYPLSEMSREGLILGGMASLLGGVAGARFMPTKHEDKP